MTNRREFISRTSAALAGSFLVPHLTFGANPVSAKIKVGACVVNLDQAKQAGLEGVEVWAGDPGDRLAIASDKTRENYKEQMKKTGLPICSIMMGLLNSAPLATDSRAPAWLEQTIDGARDLGARVILVAFFGNGDLLDGNGKVKEAHVDEVVKRLKVAAPRAKDAGVILGIENYLNAEQNARILDRINHESVKVYYDCYNTGATKSYDVPKELRFLKDRVAQIHFKNGDDYLDNGKVKFEPIAEAIKDIHFDGWIVLETSAPSKDGVADARKNADYIRKLFL